MVEFGLSDMCTIKAIVNGAIVIGNFLDTVHFPNNSAHWAEMD